MIISRFEDIVKLIAIVDACQSDCELDISFNWSAEEFDTSKAANIKAKALSEFTDKDWIFSITKDNKELFLTILVDNLVDGDFSHYNIKAVNQLIAKGYDNCELNFLNPDYFILTESVRSQLGDSQIILKKEIE